MTASLHPVPRTTAILERQAAEGLHIGAQVFVSRGGEPVVDLALGRARSDAPMSVDSVMLWLSSGKPIAAVAVLQLAEQGALGLDDPVERRLPEFGANGKHAVTIRHLLTHTAGFRFLDVGDAATPWDEILRRICVAPLERDWTPGLRAGYHPYTSWYVLGEIVRRASGLSYSEYVRRFVFLPLEMDDCWVGMPAEVRDAYGPRLGELVNTERPGIGPHLWSTPDGVVACAPGGNAHGPMRRLARFYEALLGGGRRGAARILSEASVAQLVARERVGLFDETFKHALDWGLGIIPNNRRYGLATAPYGYGRHAGDAAFGHAGSQSSAAFADPEHGLAVAVVLNGTCGERRHQPRMRAVLEALYEDLGIVRADEG